MSEDRYAKLKAATPEQLLEALMWFYSQAHLDVDNAIFVHALKLGFAVSQPGGWENVAPSWLERAMGEGETEQ